MERLTPSMLIHPGEMIKDEIECRGISQRKLAENMNVSYSSVNEMLNGKRPVTTEYAMMLEAILGIDAGIWLRLQIEYNIQVAKQNHSFTDKLSRLRHIAAMF